MTEKFKINKILLLLLIVSLSINLSYLKENHSKHMYLKKTFIALHGEFYSTINNLYKKLNVAKNNEFKDKEYIDSALHEAINRLRIHERMILDLDSLTDDFGGFDYYYYYYEISNFLRDFRNKDIFTEEDFEKIRSIYLITSSLSSKNVVKNKFLYKMEPSEEFHEMFEEIHRIFND